jgi:hypothetical protein
MNKLDNLYNMSAIRFGNVCSDNSILLQKISNLTFGLQNKFNN